MSSATTWSLIRRAAGGEPVAREEFVRRYAPVIRSFLATRYGSRLSQEELDDVLQEVFLECYREEGVIERAATGLEGDFRAFLLGAVRNVARRAEETYARRHGADAGTGVERAVPAREERLSRAFDRAWARALVLQAFERQREHAAAEGGDALRRIELLRLRFEEDRPIREIAAAWSVDPARLHHEYARARREFEGALREVVAEHLPGSPEGVQERCEALLDLLG